MLLTLLLNTTANFLLGFLVMGPAAGGAFFFFMYRHYRSSGKKYLFEKENHAETFNHQGHEHKVRSLTNQKNSKISNANHSAPRKRLKNSKAFYSF